MLDPEVLRATALAKRDELAAQAREASLKEPVLFTDEQVDKWVKDLEAHVQTFAEDGHLSVDYIFTNGEPLKAVHAAAKSFKLHHPKLMVVVYEGMNKINVAWDGKNHV